MSLLVIDANFDSAISINLQILMDHDERLLCEGSSWNIVCWVLHLLFLSVSSAWLTLHTLNKHKHKLKLQMLLQILLKVSDFHKSLWFISFPYFYIRTLDMSLINLFMEVGNSKILLVFVYKGIIYCQVLKYF